MDYKLLLEVHDRLKKEQAAKAELDEIFNRYREAGGDVDRSKMEELLLLHYITTEKEMREGPPAITTPKTQDLIDSHKSGEVNIYEWFSDKFVTLDDLMELGFDVRTLRTQLNAAFKTFQTAVKKEV